MTKRAAVCGALMLVVLFLVANRAAYSGYFQDDDLDTLNWAPRADLSMYLIGTLTPKFYDNNFRPVGHFYYAVCAQLFDLDFPKYVALLQVFHLLNVWLLWVVARRLRAPPVAAFLACLFFALHMALFDAFWKPMYVFDVLCGTFALLAILFWIDRRWVLSFAAFWLAYKAKELAVMLPVVLACCEISLGKRSWKPLIPFFAASFSFGLQGLILNPNKDNDYTFRFTWDALRRTAVFYSGRVFLVPYLGFLVPLAAFPGKNRRTLFGLAMAAVLFFPMLFLPGRIFGAYCYVPFLGLALALSGVAETVGWIPVAVFLLLFTPLDVRELRQRRKATLALENDIHGWVAGVQAFAPTAPPLDAALWSGKIAGFAPWGMRGAVGYLLHAPELKMAGADEPDARELLAHGRTAVIAWNPGAHRSSVYLHTADTPDLSYIDFSQVQPVWQLAQGWFDPESGYRWTEPVATARLDRPPDAQHFAVRVLVNAARLRAGPAIEVRVWLDGQPLAPRPVPNSGWNELSWTVPPGPAGRVDVRIETAPPFRPSSEGRTLGIAVGAFGYPADQRPTAPPGGSR